ncbi:immunity protein [Carnobacteriaceae bacterium zg-ZUI78]|nr:immunity protein [Carnobacteriaceae bacterium zg-ZUI78]
MTTSRKALYNKRKKQKPFYKSKWFIIVCALVIIGGIGSQLAKDKQKDTSSKIETVQKDNQKDNTKVENTPTTTMAAKKSYKIGDTITFEGVAEITIKSAEFTDQRNQFDKSNPERVLKVIYDVKNLSDKDYLVSSELSLYVGSKKMESYPNENTIQNISSGRIFENAISHFGVNGSGSFELEVVPSFSFNAKKQIVLLDLN